MIIYKIYSRTSQYKTEFIPVPPTKTECCIIHHPPKLQKVFNGYAYETIKYVGDEQKALKYCCQHPDTYYEQIIVEDQ